MPVKVKWKTVCAAVLALAVQLAAGMFEQRHCNHPYPKPHEVIHGVHIESPHIMRKRSVNQPLRILLYYDESVYRLTEEKFQLININVQEVEERYVHPQLSNTLKNYVYESLEEGLIGAECFELDYCTIIFKLNENVSNITAQDLFNAINNVCSENKNEEWVKVMIYTARIMDIIFIETVKNNNKKEKWYVAVYFPGGVSNLKLLIKEPLNEFDELDKYVE